MSVWQVRVPYGLGGQKLGAFFPSKWDDRRAIRSAGASP